jgi:transporter family protein
MKQMSPQLSWIGLGFVSALGAAGVAVLGKVGLKGVDPTLATTLRSVVMTIVLLGLCLATGRLRTPVAGTGASIDARAMTFVVLAALCGALSWLAYFAALGIGGAAQVAAIDRLSLPLVLIFSVLFLHEHYGWRGWLGVALVVTGIFLVASDPRPAARDDAAVTTISTSSVAAADWPGPTPD